MGSALGAEDQGSQAGTPAQLHGSDQQQKREQGQDERQRQQQNAAAISEDGGSTEARAGSNQGCSWEEWLRVFEEMDGAAEQQQELSAKMQLAVQFEEYGRAAAAKKELEALQVMQRLSSWCACCSPPTPPVWLREGRGVREHWSGGYYVAGPS